MSAIPSPVATDPASLPRASIQHALSIPTPGALQGHSWFPPGTPALIQVKHGWVMPRMLPHRVASSMKPPPSGGCPKHLEVVCWPFSVLDMAEGRAFGQSGVCPVAPEAGLDLGPSQPQIFAEGIHEWMDTHGRERPEPAAQVAGVWQDLVPSDKSWCGGQVNKS